LAEVAQLASEHGGASAGVDEPASANARCFPIGLIGHIGPIRFQLEVGHFCRAPQFAAGCHGLLQHVLVERAAIHLECREPRLVAGA
jgi:hypothetical protein